MSTVTVGAGPATTVFVPAWTSSATMPVDVPCTVRNRAAGETTLAPCGNANVVPSTPPMAIEKATREGSVIVFRVTRKAVAPAIGLTRNSTRSAALLA